MGCVVCVRTSERGKSQRGRSVVLAGGLLRQRFASAARWFAPEQPPRCQSTAVLAMPRTAQQSCTPAMQRRMRNVPSPAHVAAGCGQQHAACRRVRGTTPDAKSSVVPAAARDVRARRRHPHPAQTQASQPLPPHPQQAGRARRWAESTGEWRWTQPTTVLAAQRAAIAARAASATPAAAHGVHEQAAPLRPTPHTIKTPPTLGTHATHPHTPVDAAQREEAVGVDLPRVVRPGGGGGGGGCGICWGHACVGYVCGKRPGSAGRAGQVRKTC